MSNTPSTSAGCSAVPVHELEALIDALTQIAGRLEEISVHVQSAQTSAPGRTPHPQSASAFAQRIVQREGELLSKRTSLPALLSLTTEVQRAIGTE